MLDPEARSTARSPEHAARVIAVVDGSERGWRSLAWAIGYARARAVTAVDVMVRVDPWERLGNAGQVASLMCVNLPRVEREQLRCSIGAAACRIGADSGIEVRVGERCLGSWRDLVRALRDARSDVVVLTAARSLPTTGARRAISRLIRNGVPVTIIP